MKKKETLLTYLDRVKEITDQLSSLGASTTDKELCYKVVATLLPIYEPLIMQLKDEDLTISYLTHHFALEESRENVISQPEAHMSYVFCDRCGMFGHVAATCRGSQERVDAYEAYKAKQQFANPMTHSSSSQSHKTKSKTITL